MYIGFGIKKLESVKKSDDGNRFQQTSIAINQMILTIPNPANTMMVLQYLLMISCAQSHPKA